MAAAGFARFKRFFRRTASEEEVDIKLQTVDQAKINLVQLPVTKSVREGTSSKKTLVLNSSFFRKFKKPIGQELNVRIVADSQGPSTNPEQGMPGTQKQESKALASKAKESVHLYNLRANPSKRVDIRESRTKSAFFNRLNSATRNGLAQWFNMGKVNNSAYGVSAPEKPPRVRKSGRIMRNKTPPATDKSPKKPSPRKGRGQQHRHERRHKGNHHKRRRKKRPSTDSQKS